MGLRIAAHDWSATPLGAVNTWPQTLKTAVRLMLASRYSMFLWWGEHLINIYNDSYVAHLGRRHPDALGQSAPQVWNEIWDVVGPQSEIVFRQGNSTWNEELLLVMERNGFTEETYFTFGYSPVANDASEICGLLGICTDETPRVLGRRRLKTLRDLGDRISIQGKTAEDAVRTAASILAENPKDIPFALVYLLCPDGRTARLTETVRVAAGADAAPPEVAISSENDIWAFGRVLERRATEFATHLPKKCSPIVAGAWPEAVERAVVVPLAKAGVQDATAGFLVAGISSRLLFDEEYRGFMDLTAGHTATAIANARAEALAQLDRAKTAFFSNVSHEFRTPLTLMLGPLESVLADDRRLTPEVRDQLSTVHRNSLRLLKLVNSLLDFSRIEAGRIKATYSPVELAALTMDPASNFRSATEAAGLVFTIFCPPLPEPVYMDREMWEKVVLNLLSNAFKFTLAGSVTVSMEASGYQVVMRVADTGAGIPENELPHIFERFHRVEGVRGRTFEGSGIGLALIQELVKLHGGTVEVTSGFGEGSTFAVRIPFGSTHLPQERIVLAVASQAVISVRADAFTGEAMTWVATKRLAHPSVDPAPLVPNMQDRLRARILLVDDNADIREHIAHVLGAEYEITAVGDGITALRRAVETQPDLVLADVMMHGLDGFGLLRELRADPRTREVPVILLSARAGEEARTEGISAGADDYITKPFAIKELTARVETRLKLERLRREVRAQFETLLNQAPFGVFLVDADLRIKQVNPTALPVFGDIPDLIGKDFAAVMHILLPAPCVEELVQRFRHTLATGEPYVTPEQVAERLDRGVREYYEWRVDRMPLPDGGAGVVCYFRDVSAQVRVREEIQRSEERFRAFVTATSDVIYQMSPDWSEMRHLQGRNFIADTTDPSRSWLDRYIHPDDHEMVRLAIAKAIRCKTTFELEHRVIRVDGSLGWTYSRAVPQLSADGEVIEWFGTARDVSERKLAEEEIARLTAESERQRRLYEAVVSSTPDLVYVFDRNHRFVFANDSLLKLWGKTREEALGKNCLELGYEPWHAEKHDREIEEAVSSGRAVRGEVPFNGTAGRRIYDYIFVPVVGANGEVELVAGTTRDVTDRKITEEELRRANQDLEQFAYSASHDLKEPLRTVKIYSELLGGRYRHKLDGSALDFLENIKTGADRMEALVRDRLAYTQTSLVDKPSEPTDATATLETALANLKAAIAESGGLVKADALPSVAVHGTQLQSLFQNLIGNAIKYRRPEVAPVVRISARRQDDSFWLFCVADNGIGIEPAYREQIFGLFKRLHTSDEYSGTGIGLAICKRIVEHYHGRIWIESEVGEGCRFHFTVPG